MENQIAIDILRADKNTSNRVQVEKWSPSDEAEAYTIQSYVFVKAIVTLHLASIRFEDASPYNQ
jgi:hypothetical protein